MLNFEGKYKIIEEYYEEVCIDEVVKLKSQVNKEKCVDNFLNIIMLPALARWIDNPYFKEQIFPEIQKEKITSPIRELDFISHQLKNTGKDGEEIEIRDSITLIACSLSIWNAQPASIHVRSILNKIYLLLVSFNHLYRKLHRGDVSPNILHAFAQLYATYLEHIVGDLIDTEKKLKSHVKNLNIAGGFFSHSVRFEYRNHNVKRKEGKLWKDKKNQIENQKFKQEIDRLIRENDYKIAAAISDYFDSKKTDYEAAVKEANNNILPDEWEKKTREALRQRYFRAQRATDKELNLRSHECNEMVSFNPSCSNMNNKTSAEINEDRRIIIDELICSFFDKVKIAEGN